MRINWAEAGRFAAATAVVLVEVLLVSWLLVRIVNVVGEYWLPGVPELPFWVAFWLVTLKVIVAIVSKTSGHLVSKLRAASQGTDDGF